MAGAVAAIAGGVLAIGGTWFGMNRAAKEKKFAKRDANRLKGQIARAEKERPSIINPFEGITDLSSLASNLSGMASNPTMNLAVATQAAEMQVEEADIALANTLDALQASGASAGGATALAQMALKSKKGVSASIEQQEARNQEIAEKSRIQGELRIQDIQMGEAQRLQNIQMSQAEKVQTADAKGKEFMYREEDNRKMQELNRLSAQLSGQEQRKVAATQASNAALAGGIGAVGSIAGSVITGGASFK